MKVEFSLYQECVEHVLDDDPLAALVKLEGLNSASLERLAGKRAACENALIERALSVQVVALDKRAARNAKRRLLAALLHKAQIIPLADSKGMKYKIMANLAENYLKRSSTHE